MAGATALQPHSQPAHAQPPLLPTTGMTPSPAPISQHAQPIYRLPSPAPTPPLSPSAHFPPVVADPTEKKKAGGGKKKKVCSVGGCSNIVRARGLCNHHYRKPCTIDGCSTKAHSRGVCFKHGALGECLQEGCTTTALKVRGRCGKHGGNNKRVCKEEGCTTLAQARGICAKHGACGTCKFEGCTTNATSTSPYCCKHGGGNRKKYGKPCKFEGCTTNATGSSLCFKHGGGKKKPCSVAGCTTASKARGVCGKHGGGPGECVFGGCTNGMVSAKLKTCAAHGGKGYCAYASGCSTPALKRGGNCYKHTSK